MSLYSKHVCIHANCKYIRFKDILDIHENIFTIDANAVGSTAMKLLKPNLNSLKSLLIQWIPLSTF
jgi:hypothetical protein